MVFIFGHTTILKLTIKLKRVTIQKTKFIKPVKGLKCALI